MAASPTSCSRRAAWLTLTSAAIVVALVAVALSVVALSVVALSVVGRRAEQPAGSPTPRPPSCAACHADVVAAWRDSNHANAQRAYDPVGDVVPPGGPTTPVAVIGVTPLQQSIVAADHGRWQVFDPARDVVRGGWFSIHGDDTPRPDEWRHWTQRGASWNAQCATCHVTGLRKGYDIARDAYATTFSASGVACAACHGDVLAHARGAPSSTLARASVDACLACHARREALTDGFVVGDRFDDHFRLLLADEPGLLFADGRARDEAFEASSFLGSRMAHAGVTCLDCHEPHAGELRRSVDDDGLCLGCHASPGARGAVVVDPATHTHHASTSAGARCVSCHMPQRTFMARDARRDHAFTSPDPALASELGLPDTCLGCHADHDAAWSTATVERWFTPTAARRHARQRARVVAAARAGDRTVVAALVAMIGTEDNAAWRAALVGLGRAFVDDRAVVDVIEGALHDDDARVRTAAVRSLATAKEAQASLLPLRADPVRSVRIAAAWATRTTPWTGTLAGEMTRWLDENADQPAGAIRQSERAIVDGRLDDAIAWARKAVAWDAQPPSLFALARALAKAGQADEARAVYARAQAALASSLSSSR